MTNKKISDPLQSLGTAHSNHNLLPEDFSNPLMYTAYRDEVERIQKSHSAENSSGVAAAALGGAAEVWESFIELPLKPKLAIAAGVVAVFGGLCSLPYLSEVYDSHTEGSSSYYKRIRADIQKTEDALVAKQLKFMASGNDPVVKAQAEKIIAAKTKEATVFTVKLNRDDKSIRDARFSNDYFVALPPAGQFNNKSQMLVCHEKTTFRPHTDVDVSYTIYAMPLPLVGSPAQMEQIASLPDSYQGSFLNVCNRALTQKARDAYGAKVTLMPVAKP